MAHSVEDGAHRNMKVLRSRVAFLSVLFLGASALCLAAQNSQSNSASAKPASPTPAAEGPSRLTIEVTAGDGNVAVENASVYVKYFEEHAIRRDKKVELNVKTNREGVAHVPDAPLGRALIQVIADGWKTYGRWYDITDPHQVFKIHLEKPPKWY